MSKLRLRYDKDIEDAVDDLAEHLRGPYRVSHRALALLLLQDDDGAISLVRETEADASSILRHAQSLQAELGSDLESRIHRARLNLARNIAVGAIGSPSASQEGFAARLGRWCTQPLTGILILLLVVSVGLYGLVGVLGGQVLVSLLEEGVFEQHLNPIFTRWVNAAGVPWLSRLLVGDYGVWTLGVTYAFGLILPLVGTFFLVFSLLEDSGYLPRLALLVDRIFKLLGLNGRAVVPLVLGFGCDTMATIVTRILETRREKLLATFLLSLAIPCSAQVGVMSGLLAGRPAAFMVWAGIMSATLLLVGYLAAQLIPGEKPAFVLELPPMRLPSFANVVAKTLARMHWYFLEVIPLFLMASVLLWLGELTGLLAAVLSAIRPLVRLMGLPDAASEAFLFGFFRRDYGAAGLYRLSEHHGLTGNQELVAVVTLTLFLPCVAQLLVMRKERGTRAALAIVAFIFPFALAVGTLLNWLLTALNIEL